MNPVWTYLVSFALLFAITASAAPIKDTARFGQLPKFRSLSISPDGKHIAFIQRGEENDRFSIVEKDSLRMIYSANITKFKARSTSFLTNKHALLEGSNTTMTMGYRGRRENSGAMVYNLETGKLRVLLKGTKNIHPAQTGLGRIVGINTKDEVVYMPAFSSGSTPQLNLYRVSLTSGRGKIHARGGSTTIDWFVGESGKVLGREEYSEDKKLHTIDSKLSGKWVTIYSHETSLFDISVRAVGPDGKALLFIDDTNDRDALYSMSLLDGAISGPLYSDENADVDDLILNINRKLTAVVYSGFKPRYEFVDNTISDLFARLEHNFPASSVHFESWTEDKKSIILRVSGAEGAGTYYVLDTQKLEVTNRLGSQYAVENIGQIMPIHYQARDGLRIPALLTFPPGEQENKNLPLIALPHGGPEAYDQIKFDWLAQFLAAKGYAVLQPNFRGSRGFGYSFRNAGRGRWGREMQDDVSDGVRAMVEAGYADPQRVCILGGSYGGYSALAGGAYSPDLYRCVISVNGVSDLPEMLSSEKREHGSKHWVVSYWHEVIGDSKTEAEKLRAISPVNYASEFQAPVLLIHGKDDTVVPIKQSKLMYKALKKFDKPVEFSILKGEDHWLSNSATRLQMLTEIESFLNRHNPADPQPSI